MSSSSKSTADKLSNLYAAISKMYSKYYFGKLTYTGFCYLFDKAKTLLGSKTVSELCTGYYPGKLTVTTFRYLMGSTAPLSAASGKEYVDGDMFYILDIKRPSKETLTVRISADLSPDHTVVCWEGGWYVIPNFFVGECVKHEVYTHPILNTKESPHYAAAIIIGNRMISLVWFGGKVYLADTAYTPWTLGSLYAAFVNDKIPRNLSAFLYESVTHVADSP
jgi:hypothetical protein